MPSIHQNCLFGSWLKPRLTHTPQQRLGSISLKQDDEQAIELFEWTAITASAADTLETQVASLSARYRAAEDTISKLNAQLEELVRAKSEHEDQLIAKCVQLLNEKKLKIRNQQRLLASSNVDPGKGGCFHRKKNPFLVDSHLMSPTPSQPMSSKLLFPTDPEEGKPVRVEFLKEK